MIYQITDDEICDQMLTLQQRGVNVSLLVSDYIYSDTDYKLAWVREKGGMGEGGMEIGRGRGKNVFGTR